jgi:hypothetical protein
MRFGTLCNLYRGAYREIYKVWLFEKTYFREYVRIINLLVKIGELQKVFFGQYRGFKKRMILIILCLEPYRLLCLVNIGIGRKTHPIKPEKYSFPKRLAPTLCSHKEFSISNF